ncbi:hypothetical protein FA95DRAFT_279521 [Auriscalpium vulgare]|uniref:Uncharacterized protein n=1 Tax=Auriscalpium vulgare TaxID=40419 RepID=A0ACB8S6D2_9AGAM|nr:hypothetical protein FA95DRAFT_279521 [Auriscalpium vulgare]
MSQIFLTNTATTDHIYKLIIGLQTAVIEMHARLQELEGKGTSLVGKSLSPLLAQVSISNSTLLGVVPNHPPPARSSTTSTSTNAVASTSTLADNILPAPPILPASPVPPAPPIRPAKQPPRPRPRPALVPPPRAICPPSLAQRLSTTPLAIALSPTLRERAFPTAVLTNLFGGNPNKGRTRPRAHHAARTGCDHFFYLRPAHQPYVPALPGQPGVLLSATPREASWQEYERVLVQSGRGNGREAQWMYMGQYELFSGKPLTVPEVCALPQAVLEFWARYFHRSPGSKPVRMRIWFRKMHGRLPTPQEREIFIKEPEKRSEKISVGEIVSALRQGAEVRPRPFAIAQLIYTVI